MKRGGRSDPSARLSFVCIARRTRRLELFPAKLAKQFV